MESRSFLKRWSQPVMLAGATALLVSTSAMADDTEVFQAQIDASAPPNLLFVLDYSLSMANAVVKGGPGPRRIDILKDAVREVLVNHAGEVNIGIGSMYGRTVSGVQWPISDLTADASTIDPAIPAGTKTVADIISEQLDTRTLTNATATVDAMAEAAAYFRGDQVFHNGADVNFTEAHVPDMYDPFIGQYINGADDAAIASSYSPTDAYQPTGSDGSSFARCSDFTFGGAFPNQTNECADLETYNCVTLNRTLNSNPVKYYRCDYPRADRWLGANYNSPINAECGKNAIILVTDGQPTIRKNDLNIENILGHSTDACEDLGHIFGGSGKKGAVSGRCGPELAATLANSPQIAGIEDSTVTTYTVGFATQGNGEDYLEAVSEAGGGSFFDASTPADLSTALNNILTGLTTTSQSFAPLAVDVDRANFSHRNQLYYSLFEPARTAGWGGNLKGYFFEDGELVDINGNPATELDDDGVRVMRNDAQSFWSLTADGDDVLIGGASALLQTGNRTLYTYTGNDNIPTFGAPLSTANGEHDLVVGNDAVTDEMLGATGNRDNLLDWLQTAPMGDPLHSQPARVDYGNQQVMFVMTNQGFLHAIDATYPQQPNDNTTGGQELFAFMPKELLQKVPAQQSNSPADQRTYGLDGALVRWHEDNNNDGIVNGNDTVMMVFGMRRGGSHYYAVDVTNLDAPRLMWRIDGGSAEFPRLGETWSRPSIVKVLDNGVEKEVLAFGGGYNAAELDGTQTRKQVDSGNAIYMVDRQGNKVWSVDGTTVAGMNYAIPSDLTIIDTDGDEIVDRIYVGDLGGNIWRVDFDDIDNGATADILAHVNDGDHQTFFYPPSVALNRSSANGDFISVSIGSGNRTNPLRTGTSDRMYMIRDQHVNSALPNNFQRVTLNDLHDATTNAIGDQNKVIAANARTDLNESDGWYIQLSDNEKVLSQLVTFDGRLMGTTFDVDAADLLDPCTAPGDNNFYLMDVATAQPVLDDGEPAGVETLTQGDRSQPVNGDGILSQPTVIFPPEGNEISILVDNEVVSTFMPGFSRIFWHSQ